MIFKEWTPNISGKCWPFSTSPPILIRKYYANLGLVILKAFCCASLVSKLMKECGGPRQVSQKWKILLHNFSPLFFLLTICSGNTTLNQWNARFRLNARHNFTWNEIVSYFSRGPPYEVPHFGPLAWLKCVSCERSWCRIRDTPHGNPFS